MQIQATFPKNPFVYLPDNRSELDAGSPISWICQFHSNSVIYLRCLAFCLMCLSFHECCSSCLDPTLPILLDLTYYEMRVGYQLTWQDHLLTTLDLMMKPNSKYSW